jgi:hypothetical protein
LKEISNSFSPFARRIMLELTDRLSESAAGAAARWRSYESGAAEVAVAPPMVDGALKVGD